MKRIVLCCLLTACSGSGPSDTDPGVDPQLEGSVYRLSVGSLNIEGADPGLNDLVKLFFANEILTRTTNVTETELTMTMALGLKNTDPIQRNRCFNDVSFPPVTLDGLDFSFGPEDLEVPSAAGSFTIGQLALTGTITEDGESFTDLVLDGIVDFRIAAGSPLGEPADLCDSFGNLGAPCGACTDGEMFCVDLSITGLSASRVQGVDWADTTPDPGECD